MPQFWMLEVRSPNAGQRAVIAKYPQELSSINWLSGKPVALSLESLPVFQLGNTDSSLTDFFPPSPPVMSKAMLHALEQAGVTSVQSFPIQLMEANGDPIEEAFVLVNLLDTVACADLDESDCFYDDPDDPVGVDFDSLVIDEARAEGHLFFRLAEAPNGIVVHESVRQALAPLNLRGIHFVAPEDWVG